MNKMKKFSSLLCILAIFFILLPSPTFAHLPRIVNDDNITVNISHPEVSQAFYGELKGTPVEFDIVSAKDFRLYVGILVPDIPGIQKDKSFEIAMVDGDHEIPIALVNGLTFTWMPFYEEFAQDNYFWGPEFAAEGSSRGSGLKGKIVPAGKYRIYVFSPTNQGKYTLVVGNVESFLPNEMLNAVFVVPKLKLWFFGSTIIDAIFNKFVGGAVAVLLILVILIRLAYQAIANRQKKKGKTSR